MEIAGPGGQILPAEAPLLNLGEAVTLLGGGVVAPGDLDLALARAPALVAADGGAGAALAAGHMPEAVIGDMDSLDPRDRARLEGRLVPITEQDSTDFDKALRSVTARLVIAVGFAGARIDHELAAYHTLVARPERACVILGACDIVFHVQGEVALDLPVGTRLSLFPLAGVRGRATGLRWPVDDLAFHPASRIGTSNETVAPRVRLRFDAAGMLAILPRTHLDAVLSALAARV
ncbi:Thiamin pyrophosphokinase [Roseibacterium elongatum DSM 19469]|uniref:Thiamine diphosphokinase n=1 Tax=Roseicyclus elongatus DSM 19469 TaxID=1294273 RepID=W8RNH6_9RHOB|nr:thiamine diphosphokinase [Roseibacterium elongatum]AHM02553.1 Thiamin pyrophosphokinase [Roseibacterium elongatum DSM 19469]